MRKYYIIFCLLSLYIQANSQVSNAENMAKYWNYRYDLIGDDRDPNQVGENNDPYTTWETGFLDLSLDQGGSIPACDKIFTLGNNAWVYSSHQITGNPWGCANQSVYNPNPDPNVMGILNWAEPQIWFGKYLMILATEWKLLHDNNQNTEQVEKEIYLAVMASKRLDVNAELKFNEPAMRDGFSVRDDVPQDFASDETRFGDRIHWVMSSWSCGASCECINSNNKCNN